MKIHEMVDKVGSRDDLADFVEALRRDLLEHGDEEEKWENPTLERYLDAMESWIRDAPWQDPELDPELADLRQYSVRFKDLRVSRSNGIVAARSHACAERLTSDRSFPRLHPKA